MQHDVLRKSSIIAVLAPDNTYWLALTTEDLELDEMRVSVRWLKSVSYTSKKKETAKRPYFCIDESWSETFVWRDCIIADFTKSSFADENRNWLIDEQSLAEIQSLVQRHFHDVDVSSTKSCQDSVHDWHMQHLSEDTLQTVISKCADGIEQVIL